MQYALSLVNGDVAMNPQQHKQHKQHAPLMVKVITYIEARRIYCTLLVKEK